MRHNFLWFLLVNWLIRQPRRWKIILFLTCLIFILPIWSKILLFPPSYNWHLGLKGRKEWSVFCSLTKIGTMEFYMEDQSSTKRWKIWFGWYVMNIFQVVYAWLVKELNAPHKALFIVRPSKILSMLFLLFPLSYNWHLGFLTS